MEGNTSICFYVFCKFLNASINYSPNLIIQQKRKKLLVYCFYKCINFLTSVDYLIVMIGLHISQVHRVLPEWLAKPTRISGDVEHQSVSLSVIPGLDERILAALAEMEISSFFPGRYCTVGFK